MRVLVSTKLMVKCVVGMNGWCDGQHSDLHFQVSCKYVGVHHGVCALKSVLGACNRQWRVACG